MITSKKLSTKIWIYILLIIGAILSIAPFYWMIVGSTHPSGDIFRVPPKLLPKASCHLARMARLDWTGV